METTNGALIYVAYIGTVDLGENAYDEFLHGKPPASGTPIRSSPRFHTSHPDYVWLNRTQSGKRFSIDPRSFTTSIP